LNTKQPVSVNRVTIIPTNEATINKTVNDIGEQESQPEGVEFSDLNGRIALQDLADNDNDDDSDASDADFKIDEEYQDEEKDEIALEEEEDNVGNYDPDSQEDYFQNPIQQHNNDVLNNDEPVSEIIPNGKRGINPVVTLTNTITVTPEIQKCGKEKQKKIIEHDTVIEQDLDNGIPLNDEDTKVGVDTDNANSNDDNVANESTIPHGLESDLGPYWTLAQSCQAYVLNRIPVISVLARIFY
jgi:hypothetical protein